MHDLLGGLTHAAIALADGAAVGSDNGAIKAAIIAALALVASAGITAFASTFQRGRPAPQPAPEPEQPLVAELRRRAESAEAQCAQRAAELAEASARVEFLEQLCWDHAINPHTGQVILR